jgi:hypothetical protein
MAPASDAGAAVSVLALAGAGPARPQHLPRAPQWTRSRPVPPAKRLWPEDNSIDALMKPRFALLVYLSSQINLICFVHCVKAHPHNFSPRAKRPMCHPLQNTALRA